MVLEARQSAINNGGVVTSRGSGHAVQVKLMKMTEDWWLGAIVEWFSSKPQGRLARKGNPVAGIIVSGAFPERIPISNDYNNQVDYTGNDGRDAWVNVEPIQKGTEYTPTVKTNTAVNFNAELQADLGFVVPTTIGTAQVFTCLCVADVAGSLNDTYFTFSIINANGDQQDYYLWMNINSAGTDPNLPGRTGVEVAAATGATAQAVSDAVTAALDAITGITATNVSGTSTTVTVNNDNDGECQDALDGPAAPTGFTLTTTVQGADPGDDIAPPTSVIGINHKKAITATASTEKITFMEGR